LLLVALCALASVSAQPAGPTISAVSGCQALLNQTSRIFNCTSSASISVYGSGFLYNTTRDGSYFPTLLLLSNTALNYIYRSSIRVVSDGIMVAQLGIVQPAWCDTTIDLQLQLQNNAGTISILSNTLYNAISYGLLQPPAVQTVGCNSNLLADMCSPKLQLSIQGWYLDAFTQVELSVAARGGSADGEYNSSCSNPVNSIIDIANTSIVTCQILSMPSSVNSSLYWNQPLNLVITNRFGLSTAFNGSGILQWTQPNAAVSNLTLAWTKCLALSIALLFAFAFL
jgi:hypothetical protein